MDSGTATTRSRRSFGIAAISCALIAVCQLPSLRFGFLDWDDGLHVAKNPAVIAPGAVPLSDLLTTPALGYPIPVTVASYALEAHLLGLAPWHFHLVNVLLHLACCAFVFAIARRLGTRDLGAACAALLFGLHPVVAEPVSWVTGRKDLLAAVLGLAAVWIAWPPCSSRRRGASVACYVLGLLAKPAIAPVCLLAAWERRNRTRALVPYFAVLAPIALLGVLGQRAAGALSDPERAGASYLRAFWYALGHHMRLAFGLEEPTAKYLPVPWPPGFEPSIDLLPLLAAATGMLLYRALPKDQRRAAGFGLAWAVLTYLPVSNLIPLARYLADSYLYLPLIGLAWFAGAGVDALVLRFGRLQPMLRWALPALVLVLCVPGFMRSQARFADDQALWAHTRARFPDNARVCRQWANGTAIVRGPIEGLRATDLCITRFGDALFAKNKGVLLGMLGRFEEARSWLERAQRQRPNDPTVQRARRELDAHAHRE